MILTWQIVLSLGLGGFLGSISRVYLNLIITKNFPYDFPIGILLINLLGSFSIGVLFALFVHFSINESLKAFLTAGFLGAFTTYSTFAIESFFLLETSFFLGILNMGLNLFGSVSAAAVGYKLLFYFLK